MNIRRAPSASSVDTGGAHQGFLLLRALFTAMPVLFGLDKFFGLLTDWDRYLAPQLDALIPGTAAQHLINLGVVEILIGLLVAVMPRNGGYAVAVWLAGSTANLLLLGTSSHIALGAVGLLIAALALARLATTFPRRGRWAPL